SASILIWKRVSQQPNQFGYINHATLRPCTPRSVFRVTSLNKVPHRNKRLHFVSWGRWSLPAVRSAPASRDNFAVDRDHPAAQMMVIGTVCVHVGSPLSAALVDRQIRSVLYRDRRRRPKAGLCLFRGGAGAAIGGQVAHEGRSAADRGEYR